MSVVLVVLVQCNMYYEVISAAGSSVSSISSFSSMNYKVISAV